MLLTGSIVFALLVGIAYTSPVPISTENEINYELLGNHRWRIHCSEIALFWLTGGGFEGDMILSGSFDISTGPEGRGVAIYGPRQWPDNTVPYDMSAITGSDAGRQAWLALSISFSIRCWSSNDDWTSHENDWKCHQHSNSRLDSSKTLRAFPTWFS